MFSWRNKKFVLGAIILTAVFGLITVKLTKAQDMGQVYVPDYVFTQQGISISEAEMNAAAEKLKSANPNLSDKDAQAQALKDIDSKYGEIGLLGFIVGKSLNLVAGILQYVFEQSKDVIKIPIVVAGFEAVLSYANLGFVLIIIIIAFATIFRVQSYAMKQTLWKLIVAALLINFSLVIAGAFIDISNILSGWFLKSFTSEQIVNSMANLLEPQTLLQTNNEISSWSAALKGISGMIQWVASFMFAILFTLLIVMVFVAILIMFLLRLLYLSFLIIIMPIIWLAWILPGTQNYWQKWWNNFLRWTFFAPIMFFFISIMISGAGSKLGEMDKNTTLANSKIGQEFPKSTMLDTGFVAHAVKLIIVGGFLVGSLIAANSLGIAGASQALAYTKGAGKTVGAWAGRKSWEGTGNKVLGSETVKGWTKTLAASKIPGVRFLGSGLNRLGAKSEEIVKDNYKKRINGMSYERKNIEYKAAKGVEKAVYADEMAKSKDISSENMEELINDPKMATAMSNDFKNAGLRFKNVEVAIGHSLGMITAKTVDEYTNAADKHFTSLSNKDWQDGQWNDIFRENTDQKIIDRQRKLLRHIAEKTPGAHSKILPQVKPENIEHFSKLSRDEIKLLRQHNKNAGEKASDIFEQALDRRLKFFADDLWAPPGKEKKGEEEEPEKPKGKAGFV